MLQIFLFLYSKNRTVEATSLPFSSSYAGLDEGEYEVSKRITQKQPDIWQWKKLGKTGYHCHSVRQMRSMEDLGKADVTESSETRQQGDVAERDGWGGHSLSAESRRIVSLSPAVRARGRKERGAKAAARHIRPTPHLPERGRRPEKAAFAARSAEVSGDGAIAGKFPGFQTCWRLRLINPGSLATCPASVEVMCGVQQPCSGDPFVHRLRWPARRGEWTLSTTRTCRKPV
jgi:hypothetical protein